MFHTVQLLRVERRILDAGRTLKIVVIHISDPCDAGRPLQHFVRDRDILVKLSDRVTQPFEQLLFIKFRRGRGLHAVLIKHPPQARFRGQALEIFRFCRGLRLDFPALKHLFKAADGDIRIGFSERPIEVFHIVGRHPVVAVHKGIAFPLGRIQRRIPGVGQAAVLLVDHCDSWVLRGIPVTYFPAAIGRAVVHQKNFQILIALAQQTFHTAVQICLYIINGNDDADERFHIGFSCYPKRL